MEMLATGISARPFSNATAIYKRPTNQSPKQKGPRLREFIRVEKSSTFRGKRCALIAVDFNTFTG